MGVGFIGIFFFQHVVITDSKMFVVDWNVMILGMQMSPSIDKFCSCIYNKYSELVGNFISTLINMTAYAFKLAGMCLEAWGSYLCECPNSYGGKDCSQNIEPSRRLKGSSYLLYDMYSSTPWTVQLPWYNGISFRTRQATGTTYNDWIFKQQW